MVGRRYGTSMLSLLTILLRTIYTILSLMLASIRRLSSGLQPMCLLSLEMSLHTTNSFGISFAAIFLPNLPCKNLLPLPMNCSMEVIMFDLGWILMVLQSTAFPSTTLAYTILAMEREHSLFSRNVVV
jgi:hypothetical protein